MKPAFVATAKSEMVVSSVSPERCDDDYIESSILSNPDSLQCPLTEPI